MIEFAINEDKNLVRTLRLLVGAKAMDASLRSVAKALAPVLSSARAAAPQETGLLRKSLGVRFRQYKRSKSSFGAVGPRRGFGEFVNRKSGLGLNVVTYSDPAKYAHLVEFGTSKAPAQPFLRPAYSQNEAQIKSTVAKEMGAFVDEVARKRQRRRNR